MSRDDRKIAVVIGNHIYRYQMLDTLQHLQCLEDIRWDNSPQCGLYKPVLSFSHDSLKLVAAFEVKNESSHTVRLRLYDWQTRDDELGDTRISLRMVRLNCSHIPVPQPALSGP